MAKKDGITRYSADELAAMRQRGESHLPEVEPLQNKEMYAIETLLDAF